MRRSVITRDMKIKPRKLYSYQDYQQTINTLTAKGLFSRVDLAFAPRECSKALYIHRRYDGMR